MSIFKSYDIRGKYPKEINDLLFEHIGISLNKLGLKNIAIGRDARLSSQNLSHSLKKGLIKSGTNVIDLGILTSPMLSFYCATQKTMGAMITASHNPKEYNGIKIIDSTGVQLSYSYFLKKIENLVRTSLQPQKTKSGELIKENSLPNYISYLKRKFNLHSSKRKKIIVDCSNGVGGIPLAELKKVGLNVILMNEKPDGNFPNHSSDQTKPKNLVQLRKKIIQSKADFGIMLDGDADRCTLVDEKGEIIPADITFLLLALDKIKNTKINSPKVLFDLRFSKSVPEKLIEHGAIPIIMKVGNPFYKKAIQKYSNALIAGENSGHIMYKDNYGIDDAIYTSLKIISLFANSDKKVSQIVNSYKKYYKLPEISIKTKNPIRILQKVYSKYKNKHISKLDGISVDTKDVWFNVRISNTEPVIRISIEGISKNNVAAKKRELINLITK